MRSTLILLVPIVAYAAAAPTVDPENGQLFAQSTAEFSASTGRETTTEAASYPAKTQSRVHGVGMPDLSLHTSRDHGRAETDDSLQLLESTGTMTDRKYKDLLDRHSQLSNVVLVDVNCDDDHATKKPSTSNRLSDSKIFYVRLPPMPYVYVQGLGYVSQPPKYLATISRLQNEEHAKQKPTGKPFVKVPVDFLANGKPTSVYQWQKQKNRKPTESPVTPFTELGIPSEGDLNWKPSEPTESSVSLEPSLYEQESLLKPSKTMTKDTHAEPPSDPIWEAISKPIRTETNDVHGKPLSIPQWEGLSKPIKKTSNNNVVNEMDKGPYHFNGKPTTVYVQNSDGTTEHRQHIRYKRDNSYY